LKLNVDAFITLNRSIALNIAFSAKIDISVYDPGSFSGYIAPYEMKVVPMEPLPDHVIFSIIHNNLLYSCPVQLEGGPYNTDRNTAMKENMVCRAF
jgi:hypothetical protein